MERFPLVLAIGVLLLAQSASSWSKGQTTRIEIDGDGLSAPIVIADPDILNKFSIWNGPGVSTRGPDGVTHPPAYMNPDNTSGRFIDWPRGIATDPPAAMQRLEVTFFIGGPRGPVHNGKFLFA